LKSLIVLLRSQLGRVAGFSLVGAGAIVLFAGYRGVATSAYVAQQLTYVVSGGIVGLFLLGLGATLLISSDLHDEWRKLAHIEDAINRLAESLSRSSWQQTSNGEVDSVAAELARAVEIPSPAEVAAARRDGGFSQPSVVMGLAAAATAAGLCLLWDRAASVADAKKALAAVVLASAVLVGFGVVMLGATAWQRRLVRAREGRLMQSFPEAAARLSLLTHERTLTAIPGQPSARDVILVGEGLTLYHHVGCPAVAGAAVTELPREAAPSHLQPCGICDL
jgi:hypothetical protein